MTARARPKAKATSSTEIDAIVLLENDHKHVADLFEAFDDAKDLAGKKLIADQICLALTVHAIIEEEIFYPAAREATGELDLLDDATVEHEGAKILVAHIEAMSPDQPLYEAKVRVLGEQVGHHVDEEEEELFPVVREAGLDLSDLGKRMAARKADLLALFAPAA